MILVTFAIVLLSLTHLAFTEDVVCDNDKLMHEHPNRNFYIPATLWPNGIIPYIIDAATYTPQQVKTIESSVRHLQNQVKNCIKFVPRTDQTDYVIIRDTKMGCSSWTGKQPNQPNVLNLGQGCLGRGTTIHELTHTIGFAHEHERPDRDYWVETMWENADNSDYCKSVLSTMLPFEKVSVLNQPYDYYSVMHYGAFTCSKNGKVTWRPRVAGIDERRIGGATELSPIDITKIKLAYNCPL